jgi:hypothetical protein
MTTTVRITDTAINTKYTGLAGTTSGAGTGTTFDVTKTNGVYSSVIKTAGIGYVAGDTITILGTSLGGTVANNLILTVATTGLNGTIATFGSVGTGRVGDGVIDITVNVEGTSSIDTYTFQGDSDDYTLNFDEDSGIVATSNLINNLVNNLEFNLNNYERVVFDDTAIAFDLVDGKAGTVFSVVAAAFGTADVTPKLMGKALAYYDQGVSTTQLANMIINSTNFAEDAGGVSNETFVKNVFKNVVGRASTLAETSEFVALIENKTYTKASLLSIAATLEDFQDTINLVGMQTTGVEYTPFTI